MACEPAPVDLWQPSVNPMPDFLLEDCNPGSPSVGQKISPRQYLGKISAWYFGAST
jgi:hypothetical protein